jgi:uncharacterized protein YndB with AHSA1/START domain
MRSPFPGWRLAALCFSLASAGVVQAGAETRTLAWEVTLNASVEEVWQLFTTEAGVESWMVPDATVDFRLGGTLITAYEGEPTLDNPKCIVHRVLSYEPQRMISMRTERAPEGFPFGEVIKQAWGVTTFERLGPNRTQVRLASVGWGEGEQWEAAAEFFEAGNRWTLDQLKSHVDGDDTPASEHDPLRELAWMVGGEWIHESEQPNGRVFRVRNLVEHGPDGVSLISKGWLGTEKGMFRHGDTQIWREPGTGEVRFQSLDEKGAIARGTITVNDAEALIWDWNSEAPNGAKTRYHVLMQPESADVYRFVLSHHLEGGELEELVNITYDRVKESPERFRRSIEP